MEIPGTTADREMMDRADAAAERLLETLKKEVRASSQDAGTLRKRLEVTVPGQVIQDYLQHNFDEMRSDAVVPGFRKGRAPMQLIQKRFGSDIRNSLKTTIVGQSFFAAAEKEGVEPLGDPLFEVKTDDGMKLVDLNEALSHLEVSENTDFVYTCELEVKPKVELPDLKGIEIKMPKIEIGDKDVDEQLERQRRIRGRFEPVEGSAAETDDMLIADAKLSSEGKLVKEEANLQLGVRAARLDGIPLPELAETLRGAKAGDVRTIDCTISDDYERTDLRGKPGQFEFKIHEVKRLAPVPVETLVEQFGAESEQDLRTMIREDLEAEVGRMTERAKREQVDQYLLEKTQLDVPPNLSARSTDRAVMRRVIELQQKGVPLNDIEAQIDELRTTASAEVQRELKLEFIFEKVAEALDVVVTDEEVNTEIARLARIYDRRFDRVRDDLQQRGLLMQLAESIRQRKCIEQILQDAKFVEVTRDEAESGGEKKKKGKSKD